MTPIEIVSDYIFVRAVSSETLIVICNYCNYPDVCFYEGDDWKLTNSGWLQAAILHVLNVHSDELENYDSN